MGRQEGLVAASSQGWLSAWAAEERGLLQLTGRCV